MLKSNKNKVLQMYERGLGYQAIGKKLGISRQRVHQLAKNYSSPSHRKNKEEIKKAN